MSRTTNDKKEYYIKVRLNYDTFSWLKTKGNVSEYVRDLIEKSRKK